MSDLKQASKDNKPIYDKLEKLHVISRSKKSALSNAKKSGEKAAQEVAEKKAEDLRKRTELESKNQVLQATLEESRRNTTTNQGQGIAVVDQREMH